MTEAVRIRDRFREMFAEQFKDITFTDLTPEEEEKFWAKTRATVREFLGPRYSERADVQ